MTRSLARRWVSLLRSQAKPPILGRLRDDDRFCVLGVLCETACPEGWRISENHPWIWKHRNCVRTPCPQFLAEIGLTRADVDELIYLNDGEQASFHRMAAWVEHRFAPRRSWPEYFAQFFGAGGRDEAEVAAAVGEGTAVG